MVVYMKNMLMIMIILLAITSHAELTEWQANRIADAIYKVEGGAKTRYPYGIKSVVTTDPRHVCLNTIKNNYRRWINQTNESDYLVFLGNRYCPPASDYQGNRRWIKNMRIILRDLAIDKPPRAK